MSQLPPEAERTPATGRNAFYCPHCGTFADQTWLILGYRETTTGGIAFVEARDGKHWEPGSIGHVYAGHWKMSECAACRDRAVWRSDRMVFPTGGTVTPANDDMPQATRELYDEAREVAGVSRRAGAALARATLERFLRDHDPDAPATSTLADRIDRVIPKVSAALGDLLTLVRHVGNKSLHVEDEPDDAVVLVLDEDNTEMIDALFVAINDLVEELITKPNRTSRLTSLIPKSVRDAVEKRAARQEELN